VQEVEGVLSLRLGAKAVLRALVTGVAGFIGSHLAEALVKSGVNVTGIDSFTPYYSTALKRKNLSNLTFASGFRLVRKDILRADVDALIRRADVVFHLAAQPGVRTSWSMFDVYLRNNVLATQVILEKCSKSRKNLVFASSSSVYGDAEAHPTKESAPLNPISPYGITKQAAERLCNLYRRNDSLKVTILRYFTVYGPRQRPDMGINKFIGLALEGRPITVYGDGNQERDFTFVSDIVSGTIAVVEKNVWGEAMNLGAGRPVRLLDVISLILSETESRSRIKHQSRQRGDASKTGADISKAKELLGYTPSVDLATGIRRQVEWQAARRSVSLVGPDERVGDMAL